jgi:hypothetical protein
MTKSKREVENLKTQHKINNPVEWGQAEGFSKYLISTDGQVYSLKRDKLIKPSNKNGIKGSYLVVTIYNDKGQKKYMLVHRLVYMAHVGPIPKGMQINHKDEDKTNNCIENLEVVTPKQNIHYGSASIRRSESVKRYWQEKRKMAAC